MKKLIKYIYYYLKYHKEINELYSFSLKGKYGEQVSEDLNWYDRTVYWLSSE